MRNKQLSPSCLFFLLLLVPSFSFAVVSKNKLPSPAFNIQVTHTATNTYLAIAEGVVNLPAKIFYRTATDFEHYSKIHMPYLRDSKTFNVTSNTVYLWSWIKVLGISSKYYLFIEKKPNWSENYGFVTWKLIAKEETWPWPSNQVILKTEGSLRIKALSRKPNDKSYFHYECILEAHHAIPDFITRLLLRRKLRSIVRETLIALVKHGEKRV